MTLKQLFTSLKNLLPTISLSYIFNQFVNIGTYCLFVKGAPALSKIHKRLNQFRYKLGLPLTINSQLRSLETRLWVVLKTATAVQRLRHLKRRPLETHRRLVILQTDLSSLEPYRLTANATYVWRTPQGAVRATRMMRHPRKRRVIVQIVSQ